MFKIFISVLFAFLFIHLRKVEGNQWNNFNSKNNEYEDDRLPASFAINHPDYIVGNEKSPTKKNWVYKHIPRTGSLFIRTTSGKVLHPGELNTVRNALKFEDFINNFLYKLPNAKTNTKYTILAFLNGNVVKAIKNIRGEDLYEGITGDELGHVFQSVDKEKIIKIVDKSTKCCVEVLEQNPNEDFTHEIYTHTNWDNPNHIHQKVINGVAGKTCFVVLPPGVEELEKDFYNEFELLITTFECYLKYGNQGEDVSADIVSSTFSEALNRQEAAYTGSPPYMYSSNSPNFENNWPQPIAAF